jgi:hypothetical protein
MFNNFYQCLHYRKSVNLRFDYQKLRIRSFCNTKILTIFLTNTIYCG